MSSVNYSPLDRLMNKSGEDPDYFLDLTNRKMAQMDACSIPYLEMVELPKEDNDGEFLGNRIGLQTQMKYIQLQTFQVAMTLSREQFDDVKKMHNIDLDAMSQNVLTNEVKHTIYKKVIDKMRDLGEKSRISLMGKFKKFLFKKFGWDIPITIKGSDDAERSQFIVRKIISLSNMIAIKSRRGPGDFVICNPAISALIMDNPMFVFSEEMGGIGGPIIYKIGILGGISVFTDSNMRYNDLQMIVGRSTKEHEPGIYLIEGDSKNDVIDLIDANSMMPSRRIVRRSKMSIEDVGKNASDLFILQKFRIPKKIFWKFYI